MRIERWAWALLKSRGMPPWEQHAQRRSLLDQVHHLCQRHGGRAALIRLRIPEGDSVPATIAWVQQALADLGLGEVEVAVAGVPGSLSIASIDFAP